MALELEGMLRVMYMELLQLPLTLLLQYMARDQQLLLVLSPVCGPEAALAIVGGSDTIYDAACSISGR